MGKDQKIPYLNEVIFYFMKAIILFLILNYLIIKTPLYNQPLIMILSIFFAFSFNILYLSMITLTYLIFFFLSTLNIGDFGLLFIYLLAVLSNTLCIIIYLKLKYKFKEE